MTEYTMQFGVVVHRLHNKDNHNYEVVDRKTDNTLFYCNWLSLGTGGQPLAFGDNPADMELGGSIDVEPRGDIEEQHAPGVRLYLNENE